MLTNRNFVSIHHPTADLLYPFHPPSASSPLVICISILVWFGSFILCFGSSGFFFFYIPHISEIVQNLSFFILLSLIPSRSNHVVPSGRISFFVWLSNISLCVMSLTYLFLREGSSWGDCEKLAYLFSRRQGIILIPRWYDVLWTFLKLLYWNWDRKSVV